MADGLVVAGALSWTAHGAAIGSEAAYDVDGDEAIAVRVMEALVVTR